LSVSGLTRFCIGSELSPEQGEAGGKIGRPFSGHPERDIPRICSIGPARPAPVRFVVFVVRAMQRLLMRPECCLPFASRLQSIAIQTEDT
jgi:hypothetical protein